MTSSAPAPAVPDASPNPKTPVYRRKLFWVALLYFSEGLPLGVFFDIFPVYFRQQGASLAGGSRVRAFDASEGTARDPLLNKTFDLNSPKQIPALRP